MAEEEGKTGEGTKAGDEVKSGNGETVSKADHDAVVAKLAKSEQDLEDVRLEILTPEYLAFVNKAEGEGEGAKPKEEAGKEQATDTTIADDTYEKMSKKELFEKAKGAAVAEMRAVADQDKAAVVADTKAKTAREVQAFAKVHEDYPTYRPVMYGLSCDPKYENMSLLELYTAAKEHVKAIHAEPSEEEKKKQAKLTGEKPGGSTESYEELAKKSPEKAAEEGLAEAKEKLGPMPSA